MRNKENRMKWAKEKYKRFVADIDKTVADEFVKKLLANEMTYQGWVKKNIKNFLENT